MPRKSALKTGDIARIRFLDHVEDERKPCEFFVFGRVEEIDDDFLVIESWCYPNARGEKGDHNVKCFTILRSTILEQHRLVVA